MGKHRHEIARRPSTRFNPSLQNQVPRVYLPWIAILGLLVILVGAAIIAVTSVMKQYDGSLKVEIFHLWVGIPLLSTGLLMLLPLFVKEKKTILPFLVCAYVMVVVCACGAIFSGHAYWRDGWDEAKSDYDDGKCGVVNSRCVCSTYQPSEVDNCGDFKTLVLLLRAEIALSCVGFLLSVFACCLGFMSICCGPWMYMDWYGREVNPDIREKAGDPNSVRNLPSRAAYDNEGYSREKRAHR